MSEKMKRVGIGFLLLICVVLMVYFITAADKPYKHLRINNISEIKLCDDEGNAVARVKDKENIQKILDVISETKTYSNVMLKDVPEEKYRFTLIYDGERTRDITFAIEKQANKVSDSKYLCITVNKRWYKIKQNQAQILLNLYDEVVDNTVK